MEQPCDDDKVVERKEEKEEEGNGGDGAKGGGEEEGEEEGEVEVGEVEAEEEMVASRLAARERPLASTHTLHAVGSGAGCASGCSMAPPRLCSCVQGLAFSGVSSDVATTG